MGEEDLKLKRKTIENFYLKVIREIDFIMGSSTDKKTISLKKRLKERISHSKKGIINNLVNGR
jgi:hypothetical protein